MRATVILAVSVILAGCSSAHKAPLLEQQTSGANTTIIGISAVSDQVAWASGGGGTYLRTVDGGATWQVGKVPEADSLQFRDVYGFDDKRAVLLAIGEGDKSRLYYTEDGGTTWQLTFRNTDPKAFYDCVDFKGPVGYVMGDALNGTFPLLKSTDGGKTWASFVPPGSDSMAMEGEGGFASSGTCLTMTDPDNVWLGTAVGARVIHIGPNGVWAVETPVVKGQMAGIASLAFESADIGIAAGGDLGKADEYSDNVVVTTDSGKTWTLGGRPPFPGSIYGLAYVPGKKGMVTAVGPKGAAWSGDGGRTWQLLDSAGYWGVGFSSNGVGWIGGGRGRIAKVTPR